MPCIIAFIVLGIMGIFSAKYRAVAREATDCVFRRLTLRACNTGFQEKVKASFTAAFIGKVPWLARIINKYFEVLSWVFVIIILISVFLAGQGVWFYYRYGSCAGPNQSGLCLLDPTGQNNRVSVCPNTGAVERRPQDLTLAGVDLNSFPQTRATGDDQIVFVGCVNCYYTRRVYEMLRELAVEREANFVFAHYPVLTEVWVTEFLSCAWRIDEDNYWDLLSQLFANDSEFNASAAAVLAQAEDFGYEREELEICLASPETATTSAVKIAEIEQTNIFGTPLVFVNDRAFAGPKPRRVYVQALSGFSLFGWWRR
jgi:protein-disulfide isomerase